MAGNPAPSEDASATAGHAGAQSEGPAGAPAAPTPKDAAQEPEMPPDAGREPAPDAASMPDAKPATEKPTEPPEWPSDCETRHAFLAHGVAERGDTSRYTVAAGDQYYRSFYFALPWSGDVQILKARSVVDNPKIVHHWTLYTVADDAVSDGAIRGGGDGTFDTPLLNASVGIFSAGPGSSDLVMPDGIGLHVPQASRIVLEIHYVNATDAPEADRTGVEVCVTSKKRPIEAASHQLGKIDFRLPAHQRTEVSSVCRPRMQQGDIHLMNVTPHMHLTGRQFKLILNRASGEHVTLFDQPYVFAEQRSYDLPTDGSAADVVMKPGDTLTSVCTFENETDATVSAGIRTEDEMCQPMVVAWPAGALNNGLIPSALVAASVVGCVEL